MTLMTLPERDQRLDRVMDQLARTLTEMSEDLEDLKERLRDDDEASVRDATKLITEIRKWVLEAKRTEEHIDERNKERAGVVNGYAIDFSEARSSIGCKLDKLRRCRGATFVSRRSE